MRRATLGTADSAALRWPWHPGWRFTDAVARGSEYTPPMLTLAAALLLTLSTSPAASTWPDELLTVAEASDFRATARHAEVMTLITRIAERSDIVRVTEMGRSFEDRSLPLVILADPPVATAEEARASGKLIAFAFANIHAGEVCGKEALLMLARELALGDEDPFPWRDDLVIVLAPIYNADGNERVRPDNRPGQVGPELGMGQRPNAQGLDLNRDFVKLEAPETRALVGFLTEWDPHLTIDCHTTNGSHHRYTLTYDYPLNPSGHPEPIAYVRDTLLPAVTDALRERTGYEAFFYGNFNRARTVWTTYSPQPRFGGPYQGLRGQMSILSEAYAYASYEDRVRCTKAFVELILEHAVAHRATIMDIHDRARSETTALGADPQPHDIVGLRHTAAAHRRPVVIKGWVEETGPNGRPRPTAEPHDYPVVHLGRFEATLSVRRPHAYLVAPEAAAVVEKLRQHGVRVERFDGTATVERYRVTALERARRAFQGHHLVTLDVESRLTALDDLRGWWIVPVAQPLGTLAVYLLEPQSGDGLATWNVMDEQLAVDAWYPVARVRTPADLRPAR